MTCRARWDSSQPVIYKSSPRRARPSLLFLINRGFSHYTMYIDSWTPAMTRGMRVQRRRRRRRRHDRRRRRRGARSDSVGIVSRRATRRCATRSRVVTPCVEKSPKVTCGHHETPHISTRCDDGLARVDAHAPKTVKSFRTCAIFPRNTAARALSWTPSSQEAST